MTNYNNLKPIENQKPFELVQEIENYQIKKSPLSPAARGKVINKSGSDYISGNKEGYGPVTKVYAQSVTITVQNPFSLEVRCRNWGGGGGVYWVGSSSEALEHARDLERGYYPNVSHEVELKCAILIRDAVMHYRRGGKVDGYVRAQGKFWGGYEWGYKY